MKRIISLSTVILFVVVQSQAQTADEIIDAYLEKTGWDNVTSIQINGAITTRDITVDFNAFAKSPNKEYVKTDQSGATNIEGFDGNQSWEVRIENGDTTVVDAPQKGKKTRGSWIQNRLLEHQKQGHTFSYIGKDQILGSECYLVEVIQPSQNEIFLFFDVESSLLLMIRTVVRDGSYRDGMYAEVHFSNYTDVDGGFKIAFQTKLFYQENLVVDYVYNKVDINVEIDDAIFKNPYEQ